MSVLRYKIPVTPGPDGARPATLPIPACVACRTTGSGTRVPMLLAAKPGGYSAIVVCLDAVACAVRYRGGVSPETYAAGLRGELLAVAP
jgi:hypothetical protein